MKSVFTLFVVAVMLFSVAAFAQHNSPMHSKSRSHGIINNLADNKNAFIFNNSAFTVGAGFVAMDSGSSFTCVKTAGCVLSAIQNVQVGDSGSGNRWAICSAVDGTFISSPSCPFQGFTNPGGADYFYHTGGFAQQAGVAKGGHTIQTFLYSDVGTTESIWDLIYTQYQ